MHQSLSNTIAYIEIPPRNLAETKHFSPLFGWSFVDHSTDYTSFDDGRMAVSEFAIWSDK